MMTKRHWLLIISPLAIGIPALLLFILGLHRKPSFIQNFEEEEYGRERPFIDPVSVANGLAIYSVGTGEPPLLFPFRTGTRKYHWHRVQSPR